MKPSNRLAQIGKYAFLELEKRVAQLRAEGHDPIDFGIGDPTIPTPEFIRTATIEGIHKHRAGGYPSNIGEPWFRRAAADWMRRRFGVELDPEREITITLGSKESVFNVHEAFLNPRDVVISPSPGYPPYARGALFAEGENFFYPLTEDNGFVPDLDGLPADVKERARIFWICQPHAPTGRIMDKEALVLLKDFCRRHDILLCSDEAYIDLYYGEPPTSLIQAADEGVLVFFSLSKRSAMTGYRCGWVAGGAEVMSVFRKLKTNIDSGVPVFIQEGAAAALGDEEHVEASRVRYRKARDLLSEALEGAGLPRCLPEGGIFLWQKTPEGVSGLELAMRLLEPDLALITSPGEWLADPVEGMAENPGRNYIRWALVPPSDRIEEAVTRLSRVRLF